MYFLGKVGFFFFFFDICNFFKIGLDFWMLLSPRKGQPRITSYLNSYVSEYFSVFINQNIYLNLEKVKKFLTLQYVGFFVNGALFYKWYVNKWSVKTGLRGRTFTIIDDQQ